MARTEADPNFGPAKESASIGAAVEALPQPDAGGGIMTVDDFIKTMGGLDDFLNSGTGGGGGGAAGAAAALNSALGGKGKGKGGGGGGGGGKGTHNYKDLQTALADYMTSQIGLDPKELYKLDPALGEEADRITQELQALKEQGLVDLSPEEQAAYDEKLKVQEALMRREFNQQKGSYLSSIFGSGMEQSTMALNEGGRLIGDQQLALGATRSANSMEQLNARQFLTQEQRANLMGQGDILNQRRGAELGLLGIQQGHHMAQLGMAADVSGSLMQREASFYTADKQLAAARAQASATVQAASIDAEARKAAASIQANAQKYSVRGQLLASTYGTYTQGTLGAKEVDWRYYDTDTSAESSKYNADMQYKIAEMQQPSMFDKILSAAAGGAASYFSGGFVGKG